MSRRRRGRPRKSEHDAFGEVLWFERIFEQESMALRRAGRCVPTQALISAASLLDISERSAWKLKAELDRVNAVDLSVAYGEMLRSLRDRSLEKNDGTELFAVNSCSAA
jgi:hypothetical protein